MKKIVSCALILAALSSVASMCFAMNNGEIVTPEISPAITPALEEEEQTSMLTRQDAMGNLLENFQERTATPVMPQDEEVHALTRQNAGQIVVDAGYYFTSLEMDLSNQ